MVKLGAFQQIPLVFGSWCTTYVVRKPQCKPAAVAAPLETRRRSLDSLGITMKSSGFSKADWIIRHIAHSTHPSPSGINMKIIWRHIIWIYIYVCEYMWIIWSIYEVYMKYIWSIYEVYMKYIWSIYEVYMKYIWSIYEVYMKYIWSIYEVYMKYIWSIYEVYMKYIWMTWNNISK